MDNLHIDVTSEGFETFKKAMSLFNQKRCVGFKVSKAKASGLGHRGKERLILFWYHSDRQDTQLPYEMEFDAYVNFAWGWLQQADFGEEPDHDGSNGKGFRVYNEDWGFIQEGSHGSFVAIEPAWAMYGK